MKKPTRFSGEHRHASYGINNWLQKMKVQDGKDISQLKDMFLEDFNYTGSSRRYHSDFFISNNWDKFVKYMQKNIPLYFKYKI